MYMYIHIYMYVCVCIYTYICVYIHTNMYNTRTQTSETVCQWPVVSALQYVAVRRRAVQGVAVWCSAVLYVALF